MPMLTTWTFTIDDLTSTANSVKDLIASKLNLPELDNYAIVAQRPSALGRFAKWAGIVKDDLKDDKVTYFLVSKYQVKEKEG